MAGARRHWLIWVAVIPVLLWTLVRLLGLDHGFPMVPLMAFTPYVAIAAFLLAGVAVALRNWAAATLTALATFSLAAAVLPRAIGDGTADAAGHETISVLSANIHHGTAEAEALVELIERHDPDVLAVQELTPSFDRELRAAGIETLLPNSILEMRRGASGGGLYARLPMRRLVAGRKFEFRMPRAELRLRGGRLVRIADVHPYPPGRGNIGRWRGALESLPSAGAGSPWILAGDFNATLDHASLRRLVATGYRDAASTAGSGLRPTWPSLGRKLTPPVTLDRVLADRRVGVRAARPYRVTGTDHRAVYAELVLPGRTGSPI